MQQRPICHDFDIEDMMFNLELTVDNDPAKMKLHDFFATLGQVACVLGACGLLNMVAL